MSSCSQCHCSVPGSSVDVYSTGITAEVWDLCIGNHKNRTSHYRDMLVKILEQNDCQNILDVACGTGVDSIMLLEEGFRMTSVDRSYQMLKHACKVRWERRKEQGFNDWVIQEADWLTLPEDLEGMGNFDAIINLGNSFPSLMDSSPEQTLHKQAMKNFEKMLKPGGILIIDHLNFDNYLESGMQFLSSPIYYERKGIKVLKSYMLFEDGRPCMWRRDNVVDLDGLSNDVAESLQKFDKMVFRTQSFPHQLADFKSLLRSAFGENASYQILGNFKPLEEVKEPSVYVHIVKKSLEN